MKHVEPHGNATRQRYTMVAICCGVALAIVVAAMIVCVRTTRIADVSSTSQMVPRNATSYGAFHLVGDGRVAPPSTPVSAHAVRMDEFVDLHCPFCARVENAIGPRVASLMRAGKLDLYVYPLSFLDSMSDDDYSLRAANAFVTVAEKDPRHAFAFLTALYRPDFQPREGHYYHTTSDADVARQAEHVGVPASVSALFSRHMYMSWVETTTQKQMQRDDVFPGGRFSVPTVVMGAQCHGSRLTNFIPMEAPVPNTMSSFQSAYTAASHRH